MEARSRREDWNPRSDTVQRNQVAAYDRMRETCPVAYSDFLGWSLFRHADVMRVLHDPETFSNAVSRYTSVPHGMDPPEHTAYRQLIEPYFSLERMSAFEPTCRAVAADLIERLRGCDAVEWMSEFAEPFAVGAQCTFLGWPSPVHGWLRSWVRRNQAATFTQDRAQLTHLADEFTDSVCALLHDRRIDGANPGPDVTAELMHERVHDRPLNEGELVSILRNWTAGEVGTISAAVGILAHELAVQPDLQRLLRAEPARLPYTIEELLRIDGPLVANRRMVTRPVSIQGRALQAGERVTLIWIAANRDDRVFGDPASFRWDRDHSLSLLYGAGIHACPGAPLARLELRVVMEALLARTEWISPRTAPPVSRAVYPAGGFAALPLHLAWR